MDINLTPRQTEAWNILQDDRYMEIFFPGGVRAGKCGRFNIPLKTGEVKFISDIKVGDEVLSLDEKTKKIVFSRVNAVIDSGIKRVYEVSTNKGHHTEVTEEHPFLTTDGWKTLAELRVGDYIAVPRILPVETAKRYDIKKLKLLAYLLGDGGITNTVSFTKTNGAILEDFFSCVPTGYYIKKNKITYYIRKGKGKKNGVTEWLRELGLMGCKSKEKFIPSFVFELSNEMVATFLNRLFACDGWVTSRGVGYSSASEKLIYDIQHLLLRFGVVSAIYKKRNIYNKKIFGSYSLDITGSFAKIFITEVGNFRDKTYEYKETVRDWGDVIPNIDATVKRLYSKMETKPCPRSVLLGNNAIEYVDKEKYKHLRGMRNKTSTRALCIKTAKVFDDEDFTSLANSDIFWVKIKSIADLGDKPVWDLEVNGTHNFIGDNIFVHNTYLIIVYLLTVALTVKGAWILIGRQCFDHARKSLFLQTIEPLLAQLPESSYKVNRSDWIIRFVNGSQIWIGGFDDNKQINKIMGREYLMIFLNEATEVRLDTVDKVKTRLAQKIDNPDGGHYKPRLLFDCNPVMPEHWVYKRFHGDDPTKVELDWNTFDNRENLTEEYLAELKNSLSDLEYRRLVMGEWIGGGDYVYRNISEQGVIDNYDMKGFTHLVGGIDWGYISAFSLWGISGEREATCIAEVESKGKITHEFLEEIENKLLKIGVDKGSLKIFADHEPDRIEEAKRKGFIRIERAYKDVGAGDSTVNWFDIKIHRDCVNVYRSLKFLQNEKDKNGITVEGNHNKIDDHSADCCRYSLHGYRMVYGKKPKSSGGVFLADGNRVF